MATNPTAYHGRSIYATPSDEIDVLRLAPSDESSLVSQDPSPLASTPTPATSTALSTSKGAPPSSSTKRFFFSELHNGIPRSPQVPIICSGVKTSYPPLSKPQQQSDNDYDEDKNKDNLTDTKNLKSDEIDNFNDNDDSHNELERELDNESSNSLAIDCHSIAENNNQRIDSSNSNRSIHTQNSNTSMKVGDESNDVDEDENITKHDCEHEKQTEEEKDEAEEKSTDESNDVDEDENVMKHDCEHEKQTEEEKDEAEEKSTENENLENEINKENNENIILLEQHDDQGSQQQQKQQQKIKSKESDDSGEVTGLTVTFSSSISSVVSSTSFTPLLAPNVDEDIDVDVTKDSISNQEVNINNSSSTSSLVLLSRTLSSPSKLPSSETIDTNSGSGENYKQEQDEFNNHHHQDYDELMHPFDKYTILEEELSSSSSLCNAASKENHQQSKPNQEEQQDKKSVQEQLLHQKVTILETQLQNKNMTITSQRDELKQYNIMIKKYRERVREKNTSLKSMEKVLGELRFPTDGSSPTNFSTLTSITDQGLERNDNRVTNSKSSTLQSMRSLPSQQQQHQPQSVYSDPTTGTSLQGLFTSSMMSPSSLSSPISSVISTTTSPNQQEQNVGVCHDNNKSTKNTSPMSNNSLFIDTSSTQEATLHALSCEIRTYKQIIASLTDENNNYRSKEVEHLQSISTLEEKVRHYQKAKSSSSTLSIDEKEDTKTIIAAKTQLNENLMWKVTTLEEAAKEYQMKVADLGQEVIHLEKEVKKSLSERDMLEKLLNTSRRDVAAAAVVKEREESNDDEGYQSNNSAGDTKIQNFDRVTEDVENTSENAQNGSNHSECVSDIVHKSMQSELDATKKREQELRDELNKILCQSNNEGTSLAMSDSSTIIDRLVESQQEAIIYLTGEVENLRSKLNQEHSQLQTQQYEYEKQLECLKRVKEENRFFAAEILEKERLAQSIQEDLSMKLGENACLRDEVTELESKAEMLGNLTEGVEKTLSRCNEEREDLLAQLKEADNKSAELEEAQRNLRKVTQAYNETCLMLEGKSKSYSVMDDTLVSVDLNKETSIIDDDDLSQDEVSDENDAAMGRLHVLKKALKKDYKKKVKTFTSIMSEKDKIIEESKSKLSQQNDEIKKLKENLLLSNFDRISHEAIIHQDIENLQTALKEREHELYLAKRKVRKSLEQEKGVSWSDLSDTLIDGVGATVEMFEKSWGDNTVTTNQEQSLNSNGSSGRIPSSFTLSSKSFG